MVRKEDIRTMMQTAPIQLKLRAQRLRWFGYKITATHYSEGLVDRSYQQAYQRPGMTLRIVIYGAVEPKYRTPLMPRTYAKEKKKEEEK
ncbi:hypothetical protein Y032_0068g193 [Ancylostoma ceylanicum]|uniref:Uncharacterized protein n=1 Tax=Ancylostoma ceylanicum TaxID=53326 RepID=A0A016TZW1_9BILA|nr:hypothetical protein Y032_0068g193 [Ancylostoma ceylanicum]